MHLNITFLPVPSTFWQLRFASRRLIFRDRFFRLWSGLLFRLDFSLLCRLDTGLCFRLLCKLGELGLGVGQCQLLAIYLTVLQGLFGSLAVFFLGKINKAEPEEGNNCLGFFEEIFTSCYPNVTIYMLLFTYATECYFTSYLLFLQYINCGDINFIYDLLHVLSVPWNKARSDSNYIVI